MKNRIWKNDGLTWSTICDLLDDEETAKEDLKNLTLDLTDKLMAEAKELKELEEKLEQKKHLIQSINSNLVSCINFGVDRLGYSTRVMYLHDISNKTVTVKTNQGEIEVVENDFTF